VDTFHRHRKPRAAETIHAKRNDSIRPKATTGPRIVEIARGRVGSHSINGAYGATPDGHDGTPCRPDAVKRIADPQRLDPVQQADKKRDLAVRVAHTHIVDSKLNIDRCCIGGGNDNPFGGVRTALPSDRDLNDDLNSPSRVNIRPPGESISFTSPRAAFTGRRPAATSAASGSGGNRAKVSGISTASGSSATACGGRPTRSSSSHDQGHRHPVTKP